MEGKWTDWKEVCLAKPIIYNSSVSVKPLSERVTVIWSDEMKNWFGACQFLLVYPAAKFDKTYLHWCLILYHENIFKDRSAIKIPKATSMRFKTNESEYASISHYFYTSTFIHSLKRIYLLQLKPYLMKMSFYLKNDQFRRKRSHIRSYFQYLLFWIYTLSYPCVCLKLLILFW